MMSLSSADTLRRNVRYFNDLDVESVIQAIPNKDAEEWMFAHVPRILVPEPMIEQTYYFRWWTYRKHIKTTSDGFVITEFHPDVPWAGKHNTISASVSHHVDEGKWMRGTRILDEYITFFYRGGGDLRSYSNWLEHAVLGLCSLRGDSGLAENLLSDMVGNHEGWRATNLHSSGLYWSSDDRDASEFSISGNGLRPTLNSYQYANGLAIASVAERMGKHEIAQEYRMMAEQLGKLINEKLWCEADQFYEVIPLESRSQMASDRFQSSQRKAREIWGFLPWRFGVAPMGRAAAFQQLLLPEGFRAAHGLTTAERRHAGFGLFYSGEELNRWLSSRNEELLGIQGHECLWNGPSWPFSTSLALGAVARILTSGETQQSITPFDYVRLLTQYAQSHTRRTESGRVLPWIDENLHPDTGDWISRTRLSSWDNGQWSREKGGPERGKDYNHSTFCDLVIGGLFGVSASFNSLRIAPLFPSDWPYAILEDVPIHGKLLTVNYSNIAHGGQGYRLMLDGHTYHHSLIPQTIEISL